MNKVILDRQPDQRSRIPHYAFRRGGVQLQHCRAAAGLRTSRACARRISSTALLGVRQADFVHRYLSPRAGRCGVVGSIQTRTYDAQDGSKRYVTEVVGRRGASLWIPRRRATALRATADNAGYSAPAPAAQILRTRRRLYRRGRRASHRSMMATSSHSEYQGG